ncbi:heme peroxidase [Lineolata rhizophorae]|uniref:Heme peroxidase n=1 Tax=Lineolata rhizophorae TaxID=578093 RepID=A0A6A6P9H5_9PEZI|nr:heme peroxidase [Lineolata rhizophorae]
MAAVTEKENQNGAPPEPASPSQLDEIRSEVDGKFKALVGLINAMKRPVPNETGDGTELDKEDYHTDVKDVVSNSLSDLAHLGISDIGTLIKLQRNKMTGDLVDDKTYLMEGLIKVAASLPNNSKNAKTITNEFLTQLWGDLDHPPLSYLGDQYGYRQPDGSFNSLLYPHVGKAGMPYARTAKPAIMQPAALPDPGVIFDSIMARKVHEPHPNRISSMLFYVATIIIHDLFRTDHHDFRKSNTSSYLDLSPLYGSNAEEQKQMRTFEDGKLKPDCFSESRLLLQPPGVGCILIMFNRFHNYVVEQLALINEGGRFTRPQEGVYGGHIRTMEEYDEHLFQTGRLITCGLYINIVLIDYVRTILNLNKTESDWQLNPRVDIPNGPPMGVGNQVSAEFNLVYRWHSAISERDEKWTIGLWKEMFGDADPKTMSMPEFFKKLRDMSDKVPENPPERPFAGLNRKEDGTYDDDDLVSILTESIEDCANSFGAQRVPEVMRVIEILGMEQARTWHVATLNEFRKHFHLTPHRTFEDINPDVAEELRRLYDHPDLVELYPGLVAESAKKPMVPASGLTPSYTVSRAVLSDAVALVRGDRFYTIDYHPKKLTNWGFATANSDTSVNHGCVFYKLFLRAFPHHFESNSVYAHFPLTIPSEMKTVLTTLDKDHVFNFDKPKKKGDEHMIFRYSTAETILSNQEIFKVTWGKAMEFLMGPAVKDFMLAGDGYKNAQSRKMMSEALYISDWDKEVKAFYETVVTQLLHKKSYKLAGTNQVDVIRDVGNLAHVHFCAELFSLPLKTEERPHGIFTEHELYLIMAAVFVCVFFDVDPASSFPVHQAAYKVTQQLGKLVEANVAAIKRAGVFSSVMQALFPKETKLKSYGIHMIKRLLASGMDVKELVWGHILGTAGGMVPNQGQLLGQTLDYFFSEGTEHLPELNRLAKEDTEEADKKLMHYMLEGSRLYGETGVFRYVTKETEINDGGRIIKCKPGDKIMINFRAASRDPDIFPNPDKLDLDRPIESYIHLGSGPHQCLGLPMVRISLTTMLKAIARLDNLRPAPGPQGKVHKVTKPFGPGDTLPESVHYHAYLTVNHDRYFPFPCSMKINWDGPLP